ncbi:MAG: hypothetical protein WC734_01210 [Patescibacteria group bacterium]|jgi:hypothetical protein
MPYQSKIIFGMMGAIIVTTLFVISTHYVVPAWRVASHAIGATMSLVESNNEDPTTNGITSVGLGESVKVRGTDITLTNESVAAQELSQPFDALNIVTLHATRGDQSETLRLSRSQPSGYADQPTVVWNGFKFTLINASPLGAQSAVVQVQAQS